MLTNYKWRGAIELASGTHTPNTNYLWRGAVEPQVVAAAGRIMSSLVKHGGLVAAGGIAGKGGGLAG